MFDFEDIINHLWNKSKNQCQIHLKIFPLPEAAAVTSANAAYNTLCVKLIKWKKAFFAF